MCCEAQLRTTLFVSIVCHAHRLNFSRIRNFAVRKHSYILQCTIQLIIKKKNLYRYM